MLIFKRMMINHSTLDCHVTFSIRSLAGPERRFETIGITLLVLSDPNPNPNPILKAMVVIWAPEKKLQIFRVSL